MELHTDAADEQSCRLDAAIVANLRPLYTVDKKSSLAHKQNVLIYTDCT
jgi:hypothetical protein